MIDSFALLLSHGLLFLAAWRLMLRPDLDDDGADPEVVRRPFFARRREPGA